MGMDKKIAKSILTIGCTFCHPRGGVAQVLYNYKHYVFPQFKYVTNSGGTGKIYKLIMAACALLLMGVKLITDRNIKIVHIHTASYNSFKRSAWYVRLGKLLGKKVVLHIHGGGFKEYYVTKPRWIISVLDKCDAIITLSDSWKQFFQSITKCPNIFVVENIVVRPIQKTIGKDTDRLHLLFLGLIAEAKGIFDLLEALHDNANIFHDKVILHIGGDGKVQELKEKLNCYGLNDMVVYEGFVSGKKKTDLLLKSDAFILPSYTEGLPVSILEAMSYSMPILSTPVGGIPEVVKDGVNGFLFTPGDKLAMVASITRLLEDKDRKKIMGNKSYKIVQPYFPDNVGRKLEYIYDILLKGR